MGGGFLCIKAIEYTTTSARARCRAASSTFSEIARPRAGRCSTSSTSSRPGCTALHVIIGMSLLGWVAVRCWRKESSPHLLRPGGERGLYWHLVDLIWIFLYPLLYLV